MADTQDSATTTDDSSDDKRHIFPFFDLAAELRDNIYDDCFQDIKTTLIGLRLEAQNVPRTNLLLVSRQLKAEYEDRVRDRAKLTITDHPDFHLGGVVLPPPAVHISDLQVNLLDNGSHTYWLKKELPKLHKLKRLDVALLTNEEDVLVVGGIEVRLERIGYLALPHIRSFDVYHGQDQEFQLTWARLMLTFDREERCLKRVPVIEQELPADFFS